MLWTDIGVRCSASSKPLCDDIGSAGLQIGSIEFIKLGQKCAFLVHSAISELKLIDLAQGHIVLDTNL